MRQLSWQTACSDVWSPVFSVQHHANQARWDTPVSQLPATSGQRIRKARFSLSYMVSLDYLIASQGKGREGGHEGGREEDRKVMSDRRNL